MKIGRILIAITVICLMFPLACAEEEGFDLQDPTDRLVEILQLTDEQLEQLETGTGMLELRQDQVDILSDPVTQLLEDLQPWLDDEQWQEVKEILEAMLAQGEIDLQTLGPVAEAIYDALASEAAASVEVYTNLVKLPTESTTTAEERTQLDSGWCRSSHVILYTPESSSVGDKHYESGIPRRALSLRGGESKASADTYSGAVRVYTDAAIFGGARASAVQRIRINVPCAGTEVTITSKLLYTSGAATAVPPPFGTAATWIIHVPLYESERPEESKKVIDPLFGWKDVASLGLLVLSAFMPPTGISLAAGATSGILTLDDVMSYTRALEEHGEEEVIVYSADSLAAGDYYFEIGVMAEAMANIDVARAFVYGKVEEIKVTLDIPACTLDISSTDGGYVAEPGEGPFTYCEAEWVDLEVMPDTGYQFVGWTGDTTFIEDVNALSTRIFTLGDYSITANFEEEGEEPVYFPDPNLEAAIREDIDKPIGPIYSSDLEDLTDLYASEANIIDLTGLEHCTSLTVLSLRNNQIGDISPLANLSNLTTLSLNHNQISDISPLANLTSLQYLSLDFNPIGDISPLANLSNLTNLSLEFNGISDISPLANLTNLTHLYLNYNQISDISPLANLTNLVWLYLPGNQINDISPLANLPNLTYLYLHYTQISDISILANLTNLIYLFIDRNQISDISILANLTNLTILGLRNNQISDISPLVDNTGLGEGDEVLLEDNPLSSDSINIYIPELEARGVDVSY